MSNETTTNQRLEHLRKARQLILDKLDDPTTPAYSVAPLTNQLRLTDKEMERLTKAEAKLVDGIPTGPQDVTFVDMIRFCVRLARPVNPQRRLNEWAERYESVLDGWEAAGFVPPEPPWTDPAHRERTPDDAAAARKVWLEACRVELARCLNSKENTDES